MAHLQSGIIVIGVLLLIYSPFLYLPNNRTDADTSKVHSRNFSGSRAQSLASWVFPLVAASGFPLNAATAPKHHGTHIRAYRIHDQSGRYDLRPLLPTDGFVELKVGASEDEGEGAGESHEEGSEQEAPEDQNRISPRRSSRGSSTEEEKASETEELESREEQPVEAKAGKVTEKIGEEEAAQLAVPSAVKESIVPSPGGTSLAPSSLSSFMPSLAYSDGEELCNSISCTKVLQGTPPKAQIKGTVPSNSSSLT